MRIVQQRTLIASGQFPKSERFEKVIGQVTSGIGRIGWPEGEESFTLNPTEKGNGVKPIKNAFMLYLESQGWVLEQRMNLGVRIQPGPVDAVCDIDGRWFALEWETGNISSSHRALNKMALGLIDGVLAGGVLVLPSREMYRYLTDRVGNYAEIEPYFPVWERIELKDGYLAVFEVEHDMLSESAPLFQKGTDGWAMYQKDQES